MMVADPARDCPPCPSCGCNLGTPITEDTGIMRWNGPPDATLFCSACGMGWVGTPDHVAQAWASWRAYEREMRNEDSCPKCCICPHPKEAHGYYYCSVPRCPNCGGCSMPGCPCKWNQHSHTGPEWVTAPEPTR